MASEAASYREDVEQARRRFEEFRQTHAARSRLPEELWATAAKLARRDGITATARVLGVDRPSLQKWTDRLEPRASTKSPKSSAPASAGAGVPHPPSWNCWRRARQRQPVVWWKSNRPAAESCGWI